MNPCSHSGVRTLAPNIPAKATQSVTTAAVFLTLHNLARSVREGVATIKRLRPAADPMPAYVRFAEAFVDRARDLPPYKVASGV